MITTCTRCGRGYDAGSEEQANEPGRLCRRRASVLAPLDAVPGGYRDRREGEGHRCDDGWVRAFSATAISNAAPCTGCRRGWVRAIQCALPSVAAVTLEAHDAVSKHCPGIPRERPSRRWLLFAAATFALQRNPRYALVLVRRDGTLPPMVAAVVAPWLDRRREREAAYERARGQYDAEIESSRRALRELRKLRCLQWRGTTVAPEHIKALRREAAAALRAEREGPYDALMDFVVWRAKRDAALRQARHEEATRM